MKSIGRAWDLPEHLLHRGAEGAVNTRQGLGSSVMQRRRTANRVSNWVVLGLMAATSGVALLDLYLLATGMPR